MVKQPLDSIAVMQEFALQGDGLDSNQALNRFLAGVERRALRMATVSVGNVDDALDLVQDAMMKLASRYAQRPEDQWGPLFQRILQNAITDWHRRSWVKNRWRRFIGGGEGQSDAADPLQDYPDSRQTESVERLQQEDAIANLEQAIHDLSLRQQQAFMLRLWEGLSVEETAQVMGCSQGSVKTHYFRAVSALRARLEDHWP
ncbi:MAG: RNA polymerase sigma factor [Candidatus Thiodiazotropha lotti]|nr:RNA polymerase sigma factor [Candidatus Thiodiazotropha endoloripes]MCG7897127.1 RNA polymerase sigma factor [Candidatus Thiodiazotropha weberae]MCG7993614.1 RNA polymerase sigma factor [Candidatus Thiodiazotropha lotti]MCG7903855.1 RNA polymerase sigma factor [Candidatus Thiodiazotropha weberae]MCG7914510.1 RNA polymerase sigma factor [Candidatus Thiodiazotropha weberae]MCG8001232.1 RNA polymerase sigma factor [Candidatus Thiodiazotropha lotti]